MDESAQGAFEYILLLAGVLLVVALVIVVLRTSVLPGVGEQVGQNVEQYRTLVRLNCSANGTCFNA